MKIGISGVQGSGKTTLVNALMTLKIFENYVFKTNIVRDLMNRGFPINEFGTNETQKAVCNAHLENLKVENLITDRCLIDCLAYSRNLFKTGKIDQVTLDRVERATRENVVRYEHIFLLLPEFEIQEDGVRNTSEEFVTEINQEFLKLKEQFANIKVLSGETHQRVKQLLNFIF